MVYFRRIPWHRKGSILQEKKTIIDRFGGTSEIFQKYENRMYLNTRSIAKVNLCKRGINLDFSSFLCFALLQMYPLS